MKPLAGGAIEDGALAIRFIVSNPDVTVVIPGMAELREIDENVAAAARTEPLDEAETRGVEAVRKALGTQFCRRCNYCAPCSAGIQIPNVFLMEGYLLRYGLEDWARARYGALEVKASACTACGLCETRCPYNLPIREMMKKAAAEFGE